MYRKEKSVAPKERINIVYKPAIEGVEETVELPLRQLVLGEFTSEQVQDTLEDRKPISIDKDNFDQVFKEREITLSLTVSNRLEKSQEKQMHLNLKFETLRDFEPDNLIEQIPDLKKLIEIRNTLKLLKGPIGNVPVFRRKLNKIVQDETSRNKLLEELSKTEKSE
ncbi:type VI secretion system contractile sheath small subunit [Legionella spiritensis]|uniref:Type VI secretion protein n=1 Tax=Legionella spiritensis TaxID=452 RepID=A0A0W0Z9L0_LEGSP|nr:type VI secretion system contractile sheath small subunit [Legionella spiritensis]KTD65743.1 hypothetical protein Lspi_0455 [Legionella spiritensis]SNV42775.1 Uncharacterized protein conserved in bacteria [Legionella spiritensis]VEG90600.1 Uncharacterized protein conserved in bacteria [Legionella spiritensis]